MAEGIVSRPGENANEFVFVTPDDSELKTGEFIYYTEEVEEQTSGGVEKREKKIFARVTGREQERGLPDRFMADPGVNPGDVARKLGFSDDVELYRMTAKVIGHYEERIDDFSNPRIVPQQGKKIHLASPEELESHLTEDGEAYIGDLLHRSPGEVDINLPIDNFASTHLSILASTGSGKSYTASVLLEEMMKPSSRAAVMVLDPHAEYGSLKEMEAMDEFEDGDYSPEVEVKRPDDLKVRISELSFSDLVSLMDDLSDAQEQLLSEAWNQVRSETYISPEQLKDAAEDAADENQDMVVSALDWRIDKALRREIFDVNQNVPVDELLEPGKLSVLQMDTLGVEDQQMLASVFLRKINRQRVDHEKGRESDLDFPVFILLEEGHRFAPADGGSRALGVLSTILSEGRKFGIGVGIISQRPSKIDDDVLSQCKTQVIMQIQNPLDQDAVKKGVEDVGTDLLSELPGLTPGQAVIAGDSVNTPFLARIRERLTEHEAESLPATEEWREAWEPGEESGIVDASSDEGVENRDDTL